MCAICVTKVSSNCTMEKYSSRCSRDADRADIRLGFRRDIGALGRPLIGAWLNVQTPVAALNGRPLVRRPQRGQCWRSEIGKFQIPVGVHPRQVDHVEIKMQDEPVGKVDPQRKPQGPRQLVAAQDRTLLCFERFFGPEIDVQAL